jgi:transglutaminase superfamily protein
MKLKTIKRRYLFEAALMLILARLAVRFVPASRIFTWADRLPRRVKRFAIGEARWVEWSVERIGNNPRLRTLCLPRALAVHAMLRRRGIASRLCLGVARNGQELIAHAWVEFGETTAILDPAVPRFTRLAQFGEVPV